MLSVAVLALFSPTARAQTQPKPLPSVLTRIATAKINGQTQVQLTFTPTAPKFSIIKNGNYSTAIGFALSSRTASARVPAHLGDLLRSISFEQSSTVLILKMTTASPVQLSAAQTASNIITITANATSVSSASEATTGKLTGTSGGPLPKAIEPKPGEDGFAVVPLKYADVSEVVGLLSNGVTIKPNDIFTPDQPDFGSAGLGGASSFNPAPPPTPQSQDEPLGQSVDQAIGVDRRLNAIILRGSPEQIARLKSEIEKIDVPIKSVMFETTFVELNQTGAHNVGLDFNNANSQIGVATFQTGQFIPPGFPPKGGLSSLSLQAAIYAQVSKGNGRIISKPRIAAQSGSEAKIITGDALPILTSIALSGVNGVSQQVQYVNVGVTLQIEPRVSSDGFVTSHIFCVVSSVTGYSQGYPTISQRKAETSVTVQDGDSFAIGGLTQENDISNNNKVPILGDIPLIGNIFDLSKGTDSKTELYIVVTPHIIHGDATTVVSDARKDTKAPLIQ